MPERTADYAEWIRKRRSFTAFREDPVPEDLLEELVDYLSDLTAPEADIDWNFDTLPFSDLTKICTVIPAVRAPIYLILRAERKRFSLQNCGYLGEKAVLWLTARGIATAWQGSISISADRDYSDSLPFVTAVAFGYSDEPFRAAGDTVDRKPYDKVAFNRIPEYQPILELARLAPSSFNRQPCVFVSDDRERIHLFRKKPFLANPVTEFAECVDAGVALAHLELGAASEGYQTEIVRLRPEPSFKRGLVYQATVQLSK